MNQTGQTQDELKTLVAQAALKHVVPGEYLGVGTGSTVNKFIDARSQRAGLYSLPERSNHPSTCTRPSHYSMASIPSERIALGGGSAAQQERLICFILFIFIYFYCIC